MRANRKNNRQLEANVAQLTHNNNKPDHIKQQITLPAKLFNPNKHQWTIQLWEVYGGSLSLSLTHSWKHNINTPTKTKTWGTNTLDKLKYE